jgi:hypothetical protein
VVRCSFCYENHMFSVDGVSKVTRAEDIRVPLCTIDAICVLFVFHMYVSTVALKKSKSPNYRRNARCTVSGWIRQRNQFSTTNGNDVEATPRQPAPVLSRNNGTTTAQQYKLLKQDTFPESIHFLSRIPSPLSSSIGFQLAIAVLLVLCCCRY